MMHCSIDRKQSQMMDGNARTESAAALGPSFAVGIRPIWRKFRVSVSDHRQNFGNCFSPALAAR